jgi:SpoVK/Ycf46/Vps4 family AAA+-type ATPase
MTDRIKPLEMETAALLDISKNYRKKSKPGSVRDKISILLASPLFKQYGLDEKDILIVAILLENSFEEDEGMKTKEVLSCVEKDRKAVFVAVKRIERLKELEIIDFVAGEERFLIDDDDTEDPAGRRSSNVSLFRSTVTLSSSFLDKICGTEVVSSNDTITPYRDNIEYLCDQFERVGILEEEDDDLFLRPRVRRMLKRGGRVLPRKDSKRSDEGKLEKIEKRISERLKKTNRVFPFEEFKKKKNLSGKEELVILALLEREASGHPAYDIDDLLDIVSKTRYERLSDRKLFDKDGRLAKEKFVTMDKRNGLFDEGEDEYVKLNPALKAELLEERKRRTKKKALKDEKFFEVITPSVLLEKVILHQKTHEDISLAIELLQGEVPQILAEWGIEGTSLIGQAILGKRHRPVTMLFSGPPGTGKTLTANALAFTLKRKLITLDCSKILGAYVGESERNTKKIFDRYREIARAMRFPPVLLLNEADQFLHRRIEASKSADHMYNQMQNIFLEQLEQFNGILVATTNLVENLDPAFSRRLHYKIEFKRPGPQERLKLWEVHIPEKAPMANDVDLKYLAGHYNLSGGEIAVAVRNAATMAARRNAVISQADLVKACESELSGSFDKGSSNSIGF